jgi:hypothetical protein
MPADQLTTAAPAAPHRVFHPIEGRGECGFCHLTAAAGARPLPENHLQLLAVPCVVCHQPVGGGLAAAYAVPGGSMLVCALGLAVVLRRTWWRRR